MSDFDTVLDEYLGTAENGISDIQITVRRVWFYDFDGAPIRIWQGQGKLYTSDNNEWLGSINADGADIHEVPSMNDGRDGSSASYIFTLKIPDYPGVPAGETYRQLRDEQWRVTKRKVTCYLAIFQIGEGLRPTTPLSFFKEFEMMSTKFSEKLEIDSNGVMLRKYNISVLAKDGNFGRSNVPNGTYTDTVQKERAKELGVALDRGCEFLGLLANRTYQLP